MQWSLWVTLARFRLNCYNTYSQVWNVKTPKQGIFYNCLFNTGNIAQKVQNKIPLKCIVFTIQWNGLRLLTACTSWSFQLVQQTGHINGKVSHHSLIFCSVGSGYHSRSWSPPDGQTSAQIAGSLTSLETFSSSAADEGPKMILNIDQKGSFFSKVSTI